MKIQIKYAIKYPDIENKDCFIEDSQGRVLLFDTIEQAEYNAKHKQKWLHPYVIVPFVNGKEYREKV